MSLIFSTGSNIGDRVYHLEQAKIKLCSFFSLIFESNIFESKAVDYTNQGDFLNQVLEFKTPHHTPLEVLNISMKIEKELGRTRDIDKGPRTIDIDLLFWELDSINGPSLEIPHPRLFERSFIVMPLRELPYFSTLQKKFKFKKEFNNSAKIFSK